MGVDGDETLAVGLVEKVEEVEEVELVSFFVVILAKFVVRLVIAVV